MKNFIESEQFEKIFHIFTVIGLATLLIMGVVVTIIAIIGFGYEFYSILHYNNGICPNCQTVFNEIRYFVRGTEYIRFTCDNCGFYGVMSALFK